MRDWYLEVWFALENDGSSPIQSALQVAQRVVGLKVNAYSDEYKKVVKELKKLQKEGIVGSYPISGASDKIVWFNIERLKRFANER